jgi:hypothetical protein
MQLPIHPQPALSSIQSQKEFPGPLRLGTGNQATMRTMQDSGSAYGSTATRVLDETLDLTALLALNIALEERLNRIIRSV